MKSTQAFGYFFETILWGDLEAFAGIRWTPLSRHYF